MGAAPSAGDWPRSYEAQVREAYLANPVAQRAVRLVAESVAWAPVYALETRRVRRRLGGDDRRRALLETVATQLLLHGNAFVQMLLRRERRSRRSCFALRPERVKVEADAGGLAGGLSLQGRARRRAGFAAQGRARPAGARRI